MRNFLFSTLIVFLFSSGVAQAGHEKGNGAYGLDCYFPSRGSVAFLYDVMEAYQRYGLRIHDPRQNSRDYDLANLAILYVEGLERLDPPRAAKYKGWIKSFKSEAKFLSSIELTDTEDLGVGIIPEGCKLQQMVVQVSSVLPRGPRYLINAEVWKKTDFFNRAATLVHEVIYRDLIESNPAVSTSEGVRYLNMLLFSSDIKNLKPEEYKVLMERLGFNRR